MRDGSIHTTIAAMNSEELNQTRKQKVAGRICLIHETTVQHRKNIFGLLHKTNLTVVKVHNCPIYTRCCNMDNTCCFDSSWFWSTVGIVLFMVFLGMGVSVYGWYQKKYQRAAASNASVLRTSTTNNGTAPAPAPMAPGPRPAAQPTRSSLVCPKPPAYTSVLPVPTPQPGVTVGPQVVCHDDPPPYSAMTGGVGAAAAAANCKSVCTQTSAV